MEPAGQSRVERRLAAILAADVAGYSRLMGADEEGTLERLKAQRRDLVDPKIAEHRGRIPGSSPGTKTTGDAPDREVSRRKGIEVAHRALEVASNDPGVLADAAYALACLGEDIDTMTMLVDRALAFNPSYARGWHISGFLRLWAGQTDLAIEHAGRVLRLSPRAQAEWTSFLIGA